MNELELLRELRPEGHADRRVLERERKRLMSRIDDQASVQSPPAGTPQVIPKLPYQDVLVALEFLERAFGFVERRDARIETPGGFHAEVEIGDGLIMLGGPGGHGAFPPKVEGNPSALLIVYVDDIDAHFERAQSAGATIVAELADKFFGDRVYEALDHEGHRWSFHQHTGRRFDFDGS